MNSKELTTLLDDHRDAALYILLPSGEFVPEHFHITEVGCIQKSFIDCGGTVHWSACCSLQVWTAHDLEHRLVAGRLAQILKVGENVLGTDELPVEVEYGAEVAAHYFLGKVEVTPQGLLFVLVAKQTDCLALDKCGVSGCC